MSKGAKSVFLALTLALALARPCVAKVNTYEIGAGRALDIPVDEALTINYLHEPFSGITAPVCYHTKCAHHREYVIQDGSAMVDVANHLNRVRAPDGGGYTHQVRQCDVPSCVQSLDDILVCGNVGLAIRDWMSMRAVTTESYADSFWTGVTCDKGKSIRMLVNKDDDFVSTFTGRSLYHGIPDLRNMISAINPPVMCA